MYVNYLVKSSGQHPKLLIVHAADKRSRNQLLGLVPTQINHILIMWLLCNSSIYVANSLLRQSMTISKLFSGRMRLVSLVCGNDRSRAFWNQVLIHDSCRSHD